MEATQDDNAPAQNTHSNTGLDTNSKVETDGAARDSENRDARKNEWILPRAGRLWEHEHRQTRGIRGAGDGILGYMQKKYSALMIGSSAHVKDFQFSTKKVR